MVVPTMQQIPLAIGPEPLPTFESFLPGPNAAAHAQLQALQLPAPPIYLWGPAGSGKTHLLRALAHRQQQQGQRVGWFDARDAVPWTAAADWSLVVIDRCEALDVAGQGVPIAAAGRLPPVDLPLRDDLRTRLGWGHVFALQPLSEAETRAALRREADRRGIFLSDEVMDHLLTRFERDMGSLIGLLDRLDQFSLARSRAVTVPLLRSMLAEEGR